MRMAELSRGVVAAFASVAAFAACGGAAVPPRWTAFVASPVAGSWCVSAAAGVVSCVGDAFPDRAGAPLPLIMGTQPFTALAVHGDRVVFTRAGEELIQVDARGEVASIDGWTPLHAQTAWMETHGSWLYTFARTPEGESVLVRTGHSETPLRGRHERLAYLEEGEWSVSHAVGHTQWIAALVGRPGPGHAEHAVVRIDTSTAARVVLVPFGAARPEALAIDESSVYFDGDHGLMRLPVAGGAAEPMGTSAYRVAAGSSQVFIAGLRGVVAIGKTDRKETLLAEVTGSGSGHRPVQGLWADGDQAVWHERAQAAPTPEPHRLWRFRPDRGVELIASSSRPIVTAAVRGDLVFWIAPIVHEGREVHAVLASRGPARTAIAGEGSP